MQVRLANQKQSTLICVVQYIVMLIQRHSYYLAFLCDLLCPVKNKHNDKWTRQAVKFVKCTMLEHDLDYAKLADKLNEMGVLTDQGVVFTGPALRTKVNYGRFSFTFILQLAAAVGAEVDLKMLK